MTFPNYLTAKFADHHNQFWAWVDRIERGKRPPPFVAIWPRGHAKSTSAELACVVVARRRVRSYALYVSATQEQANKHVETIGAALESEALARDDAALAERMVGKYGHSKGWRRSRLRTASGFTIDALGLDTAARGIKVEGQRPDFLILDDIDEEHDSTEATDKKIASLTQKILPAGSPHTAVLAIQNVVLPDGIFARLGRVTADDAGFLTDREVSGPVLALNDMEYTEADGAATITAGVPTWAGMTRADCQRIVNSEGITAFLIERQHQVRARGAKHFPAAWWYERNRYAFHDADLAAATEARYLFFDTAEESKTTSAYTACVVLDMVPFRGNYAALVRDVWQAKVEIPDVLGAIEERARLWNAQVVRQGQVRELLRDVVVEYASSGKAAVQMLSRTAAPWLADRLQPFPPQGSKDARAVAAAMPCRAGRVWLPYPDEAVPWLSAFTEQLTAVPQSRYRDMADAFAMGCLYLEHWLTEPGAGYAGSQEAA